MDTTSLLFDVDSAFSRLVSLDCGVTDGGANVDGMTVTELLFIFVEFDMSTSIDDVLFSSIDDTLFNSIDISSIGGIWLLIRVTGVIQFVMVPIVALTSSSVVVVVDDEEYVG